MTHKMAPKETNPSPQATDEVLDRFKREQRAAVDGSPVAGSAQPRGRLKIFFGMSPGVGKTYAMLAAAQRMAAQGVDVAVGVVETHGRAETEQMLLGLDIIPRVKIEYGGASANESGSESRGTRATLHELDVDAAIRRRPDILLVDELAHSNAPGSPSGRAKRWQDVEACLAAGVNVYTTLNVQHLESINDVVAQITGVKVTETVPDHVFDEADEIELVDLPPDALHERLKAGKVYLGENAARAVDPSDGFFRKGNLLALRELALRRTAAWVDSDLRRYKQDRGIRAVWPAGERIVVAVSPSPMSAKLIRAAKRMAAGLHAELIAVYVETPRGGAANLSAADRERLDANLRLAESLGGTTHTVAGENAARELIAFARSRNVGRIVVGKTERPRWREVLFGSFIDNLIRESGDIDIYVVRGDESGTAVIQPARSAGVVGARAPKPPARVVGELAASTGVIAACALVGLAFFRPPDLSEEALILLAGVVVSALWFGRVAAIFASVLAVLAFNYFFTEPRFTLNINDTGYLVTFCVMLAVGVVVGTLAARAREQRLRAWSRERATAAQHALSRELAAARDARSVAAIVARHIRTVRRERVKDDASTQLTDSNSVPMTTLRWFDVHGQLNASLDVGSGAPTDQFVASSFSVPSRVFASATASHEYAHTWVSMPPGGCDGTGPCNVGHSPLAECGATQSAHPGSRLSLFAYRADGQQIVAIAPDGTVTLSVYGLAKRLQKQVENASGNDTAEHPGQRRVTEYTYLWGRVETVGGKQNPSQTAAPFTRVEYGADVMGRSDFPSGPSYSPDSRNNALVGKVWFPASSLPAAGLDLVPDYQYRYTYSGQLAERIDRRGVTMRYFYDGLDRLEEIEVGSTSAGTFTSGYSSSLSPNAAAPETRVGYVRFTYDERNNLQDTLAYASRADYLATNTPVAPIAHNRNIYDLRGNLQTEVQSIARLIVPDPADFNGDGNVDPDDLSDFIDCYFAVPPCEAADFNGDQNIDPDDLGDFIIAFFGPRPAGYPTIDYGWSYEPTFGVGAVAGSTGFDRLEMMSYPTHDEVALRRRVVRLDYGSSAHGHLNSQLTRIGAIDNTPGAGLVGGGNVARFEYTGASRRAAFSLGDNGTSTTPAPAVRQTYRDTSANNTTVGLPGLDRFGRVRELVYRNGADASASAAALFAAQYRYDVSGNRISGRITQAGTSGVGPTSLGTGGNRSQLHKYDGLQRLIGTEWGALAPDTEPPAITNLQRRDAWGLDLLGNWVGGAAAGTTGPPYAGMPSDAGRWSTGALGGLGAAGDTQLSHAADRRNHLLGVDTAGPGGSGSQITIYDAAGNLAFEGDAGLGRSYEYDAWGRLVRVCKATVNLATVQSGGSQSTPTAFDVYPFALIKAYAYDGVGRLILVRSPRATTVEGVPIAADENGTNVTVREERLYYDGVRRVQEVVRDLGLPGTGEGSGVSPDDRALQVQWLEREYVWGPGDNGIDELLAQYQGAPPGTSVEDETTILAWQGKPWWAIQDASGDVVAVCETPTPVSGNPVPTRVVQQYTYEPYGAVMVAEMDGFFTNGVSAPFAEPPVLHVGHKGLFADRLDGLITGTGAGSGDAGAAEMPRLERATATNPARLAYHTRNRVLSPDLGRWLQRDPNATGQTVLHAAAIHGELASGSLSEADLLRHAADGLNVHAYVGSAPSMRSDPSGLFGILDIGIGTTTMDGIAQDHMGRVMDIGSTLSDGVAGFFDRFAIMQLIDVDWATDWSAADVDYFTSGALDVESGVLGPAAEGGGPAMAAALLSPLEELGIRARAVGSNHGHLTHRRKMGLMAIEMINELLSLGPSNGGIASLADINLDRLFNKTTKHTGKLRPDVVIETVGGNLLRVGEVAYSQTKGELNKRIKQLRSFLPKGFPRPGKWKIPYP